MFNKIKENLYVQKFLEVWNNPRYRSLIILGLYAIFFVFVIAFIRTQNKTIQNTSTVPKVDIMTKYKEMDNYQYKATIKNQKTETLIGKVYKDNQILSYNTINYYISNNKIYTKTDSYLEIKEPLLAFDIWRFNPMFLSNLLEKGELLSRTEFSDGIEAKSYSIKITDFIKSYFGDDTIDENNITLTVYQSKERVTKVELDLTNIYKMQEFSNTYDYKVTLEYELIGQINPISIDVEK